ncbi:hypothetical protein EXS74_01290 [Candidatus Woesearchaeota archaeon]|nr:hypothetical protein [Candidatus Woesearchaeota archaeon]
MSARQRELIKDYLHAGFTASNTFSRIEVGRTPLESYNSPESARFLSLWKDDGQRYLVTVHADEGYRPKQDQFSSLMRYMSSRNIACVSVFDDSIFYIWDEGIFKPSRQGDRQERAQRIKLKGLERTLQELGSINYYKNKDSRIEVVQFQSGVVADYSQSDRVPDWIPKQRELLTVMDPTVLGSYKDSFALSGPEVRREIIRAEFMIPPPRIEREARYDDPYLEEEEPIGDQRSQFIQDELEGGRDPDDIPEFGR